MNTVIDFLICIMQIIGHLLVFLLGISGFLVAFVGTIGSFLGSAMGDISPKESIILTLTYTIIGSILILVSFGLKLLLR